MKELKNTANATLNDVILAVFSGAVRRYNLQMEEAQAGPPFFLRGVRIGSN